MLKKFVISSIEKYAYKKFNGYCLTVYADTGRSTTDAILRVDAPTLSKAKTRCCELLDIDDASWRKAYGQFKEAKQKKKADQQKRRLQILKARRSHSLRQVAVIERQIKKLGAEK